MPTGRPVKIRVSYLNDAGYLNRLAQAIEADPLRTSEWKRGALALLRELIVAFTEDSATAPTAPKARKAG